MRNVEKYRKILSNYCFLIILGAGVAFLLLLGVMYTYTAFVVPCSQMSKKVVSVQYDVEKMKVKNGSTVTQTFKTNEAVNKISIRFSVSQKGESAQPDSVSIRLINRKDQEPVYRWDLEESEIEDGMKSLYLDDVEKKPEPGEYLLEISFEGESRISSIGLYKSSINQYNSGNLEIDGVSQDADLAFCVYGGNNAFLFTWFFILAAVLFAGLIVIVFLIFRVKLKMEQLFAVCAILLGTVYLFLLPAYSVPDERGHFSTAYYYSSVVMGKQALDENGEVIVRNEDLLLNVENIHPDRGTYAIISEHLFDSSEDDTPVSFNRGPLSVPFWSYLPQIAGIVLMRLIGAGNVGLLFAGRFCGLIFYTIVVYYAIRRIPFGKPVMFSIALLPMSLEVAGSFSYDCMVNAISFLFIGYLFWIIYEKKRADLRDWILLAVLMFILAPIKVVYALLSLLCVLIPEKNRKRLLLGAGSVMLSSAVSCLILRLSSITNIATSGGAGSSSTAVRTYTISYILSDIPHTVAILYNTFRDMTDAILSPLFGIKIGAWDISVPYYIAFGFVIVLVFSGVLYEQEKIHITPRQKLWMFLLCAVMTGAVILSMMLDYTDVSKKAVEGVQGRYFLPFLPLVVFLFRNKTVVAKKSIDRYLAAAVYMLNYFTLWRIFEVVSTR